MQESSQSGGKMLMWQDWAAQNKEDIASSLLNYTFLCVGFFLKQSPLNDDKDISQQQWVFISPQIEAQQMRIPLSQSFSRGPGE